jgi:histone acetyltransferase
LLLKIQCYSPSRPQRPAHYNQMRHLVTELASHRDAWPFQLPVNGDEVTDYYEVIKEPMGIGFFEFILLCIDILRC